MELIKKNSFTNEKINLSEYDNYTFINDKYIIVTKDNLEGIIDYNGNIIIDIKYDSISYENGYFIVKSNEKCAIIDKSLNEIRCELDNIIYLNDNVFIVESDNHEFLIKVSDGKYNKLTFNYDEIDILNGKYLKTSRKRKRGLIDYNGNTILDPIYDSVNFIDDVNVVCYKNNNAGVFNVKDKKQVISFDYNSIHKYNNNLFACTIDNKTKVINKDGNVLFKSKYLIVSDFKYGYAVIGNNDKYGIIDMFGNILIEPIYNSTKPIILKDRFIFINNPEILILNKEKKEFKFQMEERYDNYYQVKKNNKYGILDINSGELILNTIYDNIGYLGCYDDIRYFYAKLNNKYYIYDKNGNLLGGRYFDSFDFISNFDDNFIVIIEDKKYILNKEGRLKSLMYDNIYIHEFNLFDVELNNKHGVVSEDLNEIIKPIYDEVIIYENYIVTKLNDIYTIFDRLGNIILDKSNVKPYIKDNDTVVLDNRLYDLNNIKQEYKLLLYHNKEVVNKKKYTDANEREIDYNKYNEKLSKINKKVSNYRRKQYKDFKDDFSK